MSDYEVGDTVAIRWGMDSPVSPAEYGIVIKVWENEGGRAVYEVATHTDYTGKYYATELEPMEISNDDRKHRKDAISHAIRTNHKLDERW